MNGVIRRYITDKRFGFILPDGGDGSEVFFHLSVFDGGDGPPPITGERVEYTLGEGTRADGVIRLVVPAHRSGSVKSYDPVKGYGFIQTADGGQCYLHKSEVLGGVVPAVGAKVDFYTTENPTPGKSPRACYVAVLT